MGEVGGGGDGDVFFAAAGGVFAEVAEIVVVVAAGDALVEEVEDEVVDAEGGGDVIGGLGEFGGDFGGEAGDVPGPVLAGAEEEGADDDAGCAALDAFGVGGGDGGLGEFHVGGFDDCVFLAEFLGEKLGELFEHLIAFGAAGAVIDDDDSGLHGLLIIGEETHR